MKNIKMLKLGFASMLIAFGIFLFITTTIKDINNTALIVLGAGILIFGALLFKTIINEGE